MTNGVTRFEQAGFALVLLLYLVIGGLFAIRTPAWQAPDEPAHYNYIEQIARGGGLPSIQMGDWDQAYLNELTSSRFAPDLLAGLERVRYENHQPPLYYVLGVPLFIITNGSLIALRFYSLFLGAITVTLTYFIGRRALGAQQAHLALGAMALVAFVPQHLAILASVSNDALAGAMIAITLWLTIRYLQGDSDVRVWHLGLAIGIVFITKTTAYFLAGIVPLAIWLKASRLTRRYALYRLLSFAMIAGLFALAWWGRNIVVYGFPDFLGLRQHDAVVIGQLRTDELIAQVGWLTYRQQQINTTFNSFWGQFGWMAAPMPEPIYIVLRALTVIIALGWVLSAPIWRRALRGERDMDARLQQVVWLVLGLTLFFSLGAYLYYNTVFVQFQGRYLFTAIIPIALLANIGLEGWRLRLFARWRAARWGIVLVWLGVAALDLYLIIRVIPGALG